MVVGERAFGAGEGGLERVWGGREIGGPVLTCDLIFWNVSLMSQNKNTVVSLRLNLREMRRAANMFSIVEEWGKMVFPNSNKSTVVATTPPPPLHARLHVK